MVMDWIVDHHARAHKVRPVSWYRWIPTQQGGELRLAPRMLGSEWVSLTVMPLVAGAFPLLLYLAPAPRWLPITLSLGLLAIIWPCVAYFTRAAVRRRIESGPALSLKTGQLETASGDAIDQTELRQVVLLCSPGPTAPSLAQVQLVDSAGHAHLLLTTQQAPWTTAVGLKDFAAAAGVRFQHVKGRSPLWSNENLPRFSDAT